MNVQSMSFDDNTFDCVVSFDAFEHFMNPNKALSEMVRVTKSQGFIYLDFGPIYYAPYGLHVYKCVYVPYSQYLFDYKMMETYIENNNLKRITPKTLNQWSLDNYDRLWQKYHDTVDILYEKIGKNYAHLKLVRKYPGLFKSQIARFEDLTNNRITIILQKK
jgi:ubiquinone/menaquinone biosynthesis C-methylase UbiE